MKILFKISSGLTLASLLIVPFLAFAVIVGPAESCVMRSTEEDCPADGSVADFQTSYTAGSAATPGKISGATCCLMSAIKNITNWIFLIFMGVAVIMVIIGGFFMVTAAGNPAQFGQGRQLIIYALIGVIVALSAKFVPGIAKFIIGF